MFWLFSKLGNTNSAVRRIMSKAVFAGDILPVSGEPPRHGSLRPVTFPATTYSGWDEFILTKTNIMLDLVFVVCFMDCRFHKFSVF